MIDGKRVLKQIAGISLLIILFAAGCGQGVQTASDSGDSATSNAEKRNVETTLNAEGTEKPDIRTEESDEHSEGKENTEEEDMTATLLYQGHGSVRVVTGEGKVIYIDPFMGDGYDLPDNVIAVGNPCRIVREITEDDRHYYFKDRKFDVDDYNL